MARCRSLRGRLTVCLVLFLGQGAQAGNLTIDPVRLDLSEKAPTTALTLRNEGEQPMLLQLELVAWTTENGQEHYAPSDELLANPPIFTLPPGQSQIVRLGMRRSLAGPQERSYRLFLQELPIPSQNASEPGGGLRVALRMGIPIFVAPGAPAHSEVHWRAARTNEGTLRIEATNAGNVHVRLTEIEIGSASGEREWALQSGFAYLLPSDTRQWHIPVEEAFTQGQLSLRARTEDGAIEVSLEPDSP